MNKTETQFYETFITFETSSHLERNGDKCARSVTYPQINSKLLAFRSL